MRIADLKLKGDSDKPGEEAEAFRQEKQAKNGLGCRLKNPGRA